MIASPAISIEREERQGALEAAVVRSDGAAMLGVLRALGEAMESEPVNGKLRADFEIGCRWVSKQPEHGRAMLTAAKGDPEAQDFLALHLVSDCARQGHANLLGAYLDELPARSRALIPVEIVGHAAILGHLECLNLLLARGFAPGAIGEREEGITPLMRAARNGHTACALSLLAADPEGLSARDHRGRSVFSHAAQGGSVALARALWREGDGAGRDAQGRTPLMIAVMSGAPNYIHPMGMLEFLIPLSDPDARDEEGRNALMCALDRRFNETAMILAPLTDLRARDNKGLSAMEHATGAKAAEMRGALEALQQAKELRAAIPSPALARAAPRGI